MSAAGVPKPPRGPIFVAKPCFDRAEEQGVVEALRSGWVAQGPRVAEFETALADRVGAREAVAVSSGTTALFLVMHALGIGPGDEVIVPSLTFIASANSVVHTGATPVFVDVDPRSYNLDPDEVARALTPRTKAIMVVHQIGMPADLDRLEAIAGESEVSIVEDAACGLGSLYKGRPIGGGKSPVCFSFHPRKVISTGEGGMITTSDSEFASRLRRLRHQGMSVSDLERHHATRLVIEDYPEIGYNFRLSDLQAAVGVAQLAKLDGFLERRRAIAAAYDTALSQIANVDGPFVPDFATPSYQSYTARLRNATRAQRDQVIQLLRERGIATRPAVMASHREPCYREARCVGSLPHTVAASDQTVSLPIYPDLADDERAYVSEQLCRVVDRVLSGA